MSSDYKDYILELLEPCGNIRARAMFGCFGIYKDDLMFALIADDELFFKVDKSNKEIFLSYASIPFMFDAKGKKIKMSYWRVPAEIIEDQDLLQDWVDSSHLVAMNAKKK